jgi:hypothetical protein
MAKPFLDQKQNTVIALRAFAQQLVFLKQDLEQATILRSESLDEIRKGLDLAWIGATRLAAEIELEPKVTIETVDATVTSIH